MPEFVFTVDCMGEKNCQEIRKYMTSRGFSTESAENTLRGDHHGFKVFPSEKEAYKEADTLGRKYDKQIYQLHVKTMK